MHKPAKTEPIEWATIERTHTCPKDEDEAPVAKDRVAVKAVDAAEAEGAKQSPRQQQLLNSAHGSLAILPMTGSSSQ